MSTSNASEKEVVGEIIPAEPITVSFAKSFVSLLAKIDEAYQKERGKTISEAFEDAALDPAYQWQINFEKKQWIGQPTPKPVT